MTATTGEAATKATPTTMRAIIDATILLLCFAPSPSSRCTSAVATADISNINNS